MESITEEEIKHIFVSGHRNPDIDSLASSYALAELRKRHSDIPITAICPGILSERAKFLFSKFHLTPPTPRRDIYLKMVDIMDTAAPTIKTGTPLMEAVKTLNATPDYPRLPVVDENGRFAGMLSPINLLSRLLDVGTDMANSLAGRLIRTSIGLIQQVIEADAQTLFEAEKLQDFKVYVAAMGLESFNTHLPINEANELALICGDRPEIHLKALQHKIRLLIVTGEREIEPLILKEAKSQHITILRTHFDSAAVIRRLKFSIPVEDFGFGKDQFILNTSDRVHGLENRIMAHAEDVIPVVDEMCRYKGVIRKKNISGQPPFRMILVDHNEPEQSIPGIEEIPVIEVVDHHRIGMMRTSVPIKFTGDIVGSTCTLVAAMFKSTGESLTADLAGILLGGVVTDTLNLKSPTTAPLDHRICEWLEKISGVKATTLMDELSLIDSPLASLPPQEVIDSDRKSYTDGRFHFSLSQVEETNLELLHSRKGELKNAMLKTMEKENLNFMALMVTDAVRENSELLIFGDATVIRDLPYRKISDDIFLMPGVLSRKKQLLPQVLAITAELNRL